MELELRTYTLHLKHAFGISRETYSEQKTLIVALRDADKTGYGEATTNPYYGITLEKLRDELEGIKEQLKSYVFSTPEVLHQWAKTRGLSNFSLCALDLAANDLYGKLRNQPLYKLWGTSMDHYPITNYTIGLDTVETMVAKMKEKPWPIYKIKLGTQDDVGIVAALRKHTSSIFRVDANCAWTPEETISNAVELKRLGVEFIEQPLKADDWEGMEQVAHKCCLPIIADESCIEEGDVEQCALHFNGINIKLTKCGGLTPARRMIAQARELGLKVMVGCMTESSVGISAIAQLLPQLDYVDMDGALLLREDVAEGVRIEDQGTVIFPETGGSGIRLLD